MTPAEIRTAVRTLQAQGHSLREISRLLALSRNTVRRILREPDPGAAAAAPCDEATLAMVKAAFERARGNVVRVRELLADDGLEVSYSSLTRSVREAGLRSPPQRVGEYQFVPGQEMQHDTSPHRVTFANTDKLVTIQCAGLVLAYSRRLFIQYYPRFTRFEARAFLLDAAHFMAGVCPVCVIDNTSVLLAAGTGADAVIAPEMAAFARTLGFRFRAHRVGNPERKGRIERSFAYVENNFLAGRSFADFDDLNRQALAWCSEVANRKPKAALGMSPDAAYVIEQPHLVPLPGALPPVYELLERVVDLYGYVSVDTNCYSVPERFVAKSVAVYKLPAEIHVHHKGVTIAVHRRLIAQRDAKRTLPGHHTIPVRQGRGTAAEEALLCGHHPSLDRYAAALKQHSHGYGRRPLRRLIERFSASEAAALPMIRRRIAKAPCCTPTKARPGTTCTPGSPCGGSTIRRATASTAPAPTVQSLSSRGCAAARSGIITTSPADISSATPRKPPGEKTPVASATASNCTALSAWR